MTDATDLTRLPTSQRKPFLQGWSRPFTWVAAAVLGLIVVAAVAIAATAAAMLGLLVAFGALVLRFAPRKRTEKSRVVMLEGRQTPDGWVVEAASPR